jgi:hypothetical protein
MSPLTAKEGREDAKAPMPVGRNGAVSYWNCIKRRRKWQAPVRLADLHPMRLFAFA